MQLSEMPNCLCGVKAWQPGGWMVSGASVMHFHCENCRRNAIEVYYGTGVLLMTTTIRKFRKSDDAYINGPLMTALQFRQMRVDEARGVITNRYWDMACDAVGVPRGTRIDKMPGARRKEFRLVFSRDAADADYKVPPGMGEPFIPPQLPTSLTAFTRVRHHSNRWRQVSRQETEALQVPLDPQRIAHDKFWDEIFYALGPLADIIHPATIPNEYEESPHEPWYRFRLNGCVFTVGPRHSVLSISVVFPRRMDFSAIEALGKRDNVTYGWAERGGHIHAKDKYRFVEYMTVLIGMAKNIEKSAVA